MLGVVTVLNVSVLVRKDCKRGSASGFDAREPEVAVTFLRSHCQGPAQLGGCDNPTEVFQKKDSMGKGYRGCLLYS